MKRAAEGGNATMVESKDFESTAEALGYGGVKYFDLRQNRLSDYRFNYSKMLAHNGDTAVYMQYAHARIASIGRKAGVDPASVDPSVMQLNHEAEINLAFQVTRFQVREMSVNGLGGCLGSSVMLRPCGCCGAGSGVID